MEFYKNIGRILLIFNLISVFFLILTIFVYSMIQYMFQPLVSITQMLFSSPEAQAILFKILDLALILPSMLDYAFLLLVITLAFDLFVISWKTKTGSLLHTLMFILSGFPVWVYFMSIVNKFKDWAVNYLGSAITYTVNMRFYSYIQQNSLEISIILFLIAISIRSIEWGNIPVFNSNGEKIKDELNYNEVIKQ